MIVASQTCQIKRFNVKDMFAFSGKFAVFYQPSVPQPPLQLHRRIYGGCKTHKNMESKSFFWLFWANVERWQDMVLTESVEEDLLILLI